MNRKVGEQIGLSLGKVLDVDVPGDDIGWRRFLRVRVEVELRKAMARERTLNLNHRSMCVPVKYEKLPKICFRCGKILHGKQGCDSDFSSSNQKSLFERQYGSWVRANYSVRRKWHADFISKGDHCRSSGNGVNHICHVDADSSRSPSKIDDGIQCRLPQKQLAVNSGGYGKEIEEVTVIRNKGSKTDELGVVMSVTCQETVPVLRELPIQVTDAWKEWAETLDLFKTSPSKQTISYNPRKHAVHGPFSPLDSDSAQENVRGLISSTKVKFLKNKLTWKRRKARGYGVKGKSDTHQLSKKHSKLVLVDEVCEMESNKRIKIDWVIFKLKLRFYRWRLWSSPAGSHDCL